MLYQSSFFEASIWFIIPDFILCIIAHNLILDLLLIIWH